jgi:hypothetical protein
MAVPGNSTSHQFELSLETAAMALMHAPSLRAAWRYMPVSQHPTIGEQRKDCNFNIAVYMWVCLKIECPKFDGLPSFLPLEVQICQTIPLFA